MKAILAASLLLFSAVACQPRVEVGSEPQQAEVSLHVTNNLSRAINVYVRYAGNDLFVGQVSGGMAEHLPVSGVPAGASVTLRAVTTDGATTYTRDNVVLSGMFTWRVP